LRDWRSSIDERARPNVNMERACHFLDQDRSLEDKRRFFILILGRTGSSLLASILNDAGADFDGLDQTNWDPTGGAFEHPKLIPIVREFRKMSEIGALRPMQLMPRLKWDLARHNAKRALKELLPRARYLKGDLAPAVHLSARLGYAPTVILSYRKFAPLYKSIGHMHPQLPDFHAQQYVQSLRNGLGLAAIYGGCVIDYDEIMDVHADDWIVALSQATGLPEHEIKSARNERVDGNGDSVDE
jgi:hypothetical protein